MTDTLLDEIYEAGLAPDRWPRILERLAVLGGGAGAAFISGSGDASLSLATPEVQRLIADKAALGLSNPRVAAGLARRHPGFLQDHDLLPREVIERDPFFAEFMRPRGYGWCLGTAVFVPGFDAICLGVERRYADGPAGAATVATFDALRPHLARAVLVSARLSLERARAQAAALEALDIPAAALARSGRLLSANRLFEALVPSVAEDRAEGLRLVDAAAHQQLRRALATGQGASFPVQRGVLAHVVPVRGDARAGFCAAAALLLVTRVSAPPAPPAQLLEALFDLTPAEARVARAVAEAQPPEAVAGALGVSVETVRKQLRAVFAKTGTSRQAELVRLLAGLGRRG